LHKSFIKIEPALTEKTEHEANMVTEFCNPTYLGGIDLEDCSSKLACTKIGEIPSQPIKTGHGSMYLPSQVGEECN
jgi:hypothetical protein